MSRRLGSTYRTEDELARPTPVEVRNNQGDIIATIDPVTRERRSLTGRLEGVLTPQGWDLDMGRRPAVGKRSERIPYAEYQPRHAKSGRAKDRDTRSGYEAGRRGWRKRGRGRGKKGLTAQTS